MDIQERIKMIMKMNNLTASSFAEKIGVQRSSISHILSGRNKPSIDFLEKTLKTFPKVNGDWLIMGKVHQTAEKREEQKTTDTKEVIKPSEKENKESTNDSASNMDKKIERIIVFYRDGTFVETKP